VLKTSRSNANPVIALDTKAKVEFKPAFASSNRLPWQVGASPDRAARSAIHPLAGARTEEFPHPQSSVGQGQDDRPPNEAAVREELKRILASRTFSRAIQMSSLLEWISERWLAGEIDQLDGYHIVRAVQHRSEVPEAQFNSTGRVYVGRLREQLERYYATEGSADDVRIEIPRGAYIPVAHCQPSSDKVSTYQVGSERTTLMVLPFHSWNASAASLVPNPLIITDYLISWLTRTSSVRVTSRVSSSHVDFASDAKLLGKQFGAEFLVEGTVHQEADNCEIIVHLSETTEGYNIWSGHYRAGAPLLDISRQIVHDLLEKIKEPVKQR
jgi:TolB-like protein